MTLGLALQPYLAMFGSRFREELQYRAAALAGLTTQVVFGFIILMVLLAFYASSDVVLPISVSQTIVYVWLSQGLLGLLPWNVDPNAMTAIRTGEVVHELLRPVDTYKLWFARVLAWRLVRTTLRFVPMVVLAMLVFPQVGLGDYAMHTPASLMALGLFFVAVVLAALLSTTMTVLLQVVMLWTVSPEGVIRTIPVFAIFLSGTLIPLPLFPAAFQPFLASQPFRGIVDTPNRIYSGDLTGEAAWFALGWSVLWIVALLWLGGWAMRKGLTRLTVAGG